MGKEITTVSDIIRVHGIERAEKAALVLGEKSQTWGELYQRSSQMAQALRAAGVKEGDRVSFLDKNSIEHFEVFYGCALLNAVCVDVNWRLAAPEVEYIVNDAGSTVFIVSEDFRSIAEAIADQLNPASVVVVIGCSGASVGKLNTISYEALLQPEGMSNPKV